MTQNIITGIDALPQLLAGKKTLLVCGNSFDRLPGTENMAALAAARFSNFHPNPVYEDICEGTAVFNVHGCDAILAVGGGSAIDVAKCIKLFCRMEPGTDFLAQERTDTGILLIAVPTTAGTGSESTRHAVCYRNGVKQSISHPSLVPNVAVLDPSLLANLPLYQRKCTMLDAFGQAVESWWSVSSTDESAAFSKQAIELIRDNWQGYLLEESADSATAILTAANLSGQAINITATTAAHAMSYKITSLYGLPHGHAVGLCLYQVWRYMLDHSATCSDPRGEGRLLEVFQQLPVTLDWYAELLSNLEMAYPVSDNLDEDLGILVKSVNPERLGNNPVPLNAETLTQLYTNIVKRKEFQ